MVWESIIKEDSQYDDKVSSLMLKYANIVYDGSKILIEMNRIAEEHADDRLLAMLREYANMNIKSNEFMLKMVQFSKKRGEHT